MDAQQKAKLKKQLLEKRATLKAQTTLPHDIADPSDTLDEKATDVTNLEQERAVEQSLELQLREIDQTLQKLDEGTYGICTTCNVVIEKKRLQAMPVVQRCFDCANKATLS